MLRAMVGALAYVGLFAFLLFVPGASIHSARAWVLLGTLTIVRVAGALVVHRANPALLRERRTIFHPEQPRADRLLLALWMAGFAALVALAAYDGSGRQRWGIVPPALAALGLALFVGGWLLVFHVLRVNAFAVTVVRHQPDRQHRVTDTGAYALVRHPMYAGALILVVGMCLWLQSWLALGASIVPLGALVGRIGLEEPLLRAHLVGYGAYAERVRYRLVPGLW